MEANLPEKSDGDFRDVVITSNLKYTAAPQMTQSLAARRKGLFFRIAFGLIGLVIIISTAMITVRNNPGNPDAAEPSTAGEVAMFLERAGTSLPWNEVTGIMDDDMLKVQVIAMKPGIAWMDLYNKSGKGLATDAGQEVPTLVLNPGMPSFFTFRFPLSPALSEGVLVVLVCDNQALGGLQPNRNELRDWMDGVFNHDQEFMNGCTGHRLPLH